MDMKWEIGDRVSRLLFMDDGTWWKHGDTCLKYSPTRYGNIIKIYQKKSCIDGLKWTNNMIDVQWDDGETKSYLDHGVTKVLNSRDDAEVYDWDIWWCGYFEDTTTDSNDEEREFSETYLRSRLWTYHNYPLYDLKLNILNK